jgi:hypothetical protein
MRPTPELEEAVKDLIMDLCGTLYCHGYQQVSVGAIMRLIGVPPERASEHDGNIIDLHDQFAKSAVRPKNLEVPPGTVFH